MKKPIAAIIIAFFCLICTLSLSACSADRQYTETFTGFLSEKTYDSEKSCVKAFLQTELGGKSLQCTLIDYSSGVPLSKTEIEKLDLGEQIDAAYPVEIKYRSAYSDKDCTASVYLIDLPKGYKYFAPTPKLGEAVTASYYNYIINSTAYENCTVNTTYSGHIFSVDSVYYMNYMFDYDKAYFKQTVPSMEVDFYLADTDKGFEYYSRLPEMGQSGYYTNSEINDWVKKKYGAEYYFEGYYLIKGGNTYKLDSFKSVSDLSTFMYAADFDNTYFEKTDYGFCMTDGKFKEAIYALMGDESDSDMRFEINEHLKNVNVKYYVSDGHFTNIDFIFQAQIGESAKDIIAIEMHTEFKDFKTTTVLLPV